VFAGSFAKRYGLSALEGSTRSHFPPLGHARATRISALESELWTPCMLRWKEKGRRTNQRVRGQLRVQLSHSIMEDPGSWEELATRCRPQHPILAFLLSVSSRGRGLCDQIRRARTVFLLAVITSGPVENVYHRI
jgi:hypothetical protein